MSRFSRLKSFFTLGADTNKVDESRIEQDAGVVSELVSELDVDTSDDELLSREKTWLQAYERYNAKIQERQKKNEEYWLGTQNETILDTDDDRQLHDNLIFEALETFLPMATRQSPDPVVSADESEEGRALSDKVRKMLISLADRKRLRLKLKSMTRNWTLYYLGVIKVGWNIIDDEVSMDVIRPQRMILDPQATIEEGGEYTGEYLGYLRKDVASSLARRFPDAKSDIEEVVQGKMGTLVNYREWWADGGQIVFWTLNNRVLGKARNPHWNYPTEEDSVDEYGEQTRKQAQRLNHFNTPQFPFVFLSMFNLGMQPHDSTSLIEQNIPNQDLINRRYRQIDQNVSDMNGGWAISGDRSGISKEQAKGAIDAFRAGRGVWIPQGDIGAAVQRITGSGLPADVFNQLQDARNELRGVFGIKGSTPQGVQSEETVRGKILQKEQDDSRIGGGIVEYLEQVSDRIYNWLVQLIMVYYDEEHVGSVIGEANASEFVRLKADDFDRRLNVSVKEGSMIPKDPLTQRNEAIDLWGAGAIDPITLHTRLDTPDPRETAMRLVQFQTEPQALFPELMQQQAIQQGAQPAQGGGQARQGGQGGGQAQQGEGGARQRVAQALQELGQE